MKALQKQPKPAGYEEYVTAKLLYSKQASFDSRLRRKLKGREDAAAIVALYKQTKEFSAQSKVFNAARARYQRAVVEMELEQRGFSLEEIGITTIAEMMEIKIPTTTQELVAEHRKQQIAASITDKERAEILEGIRLHQERQSARVSMKDTFTALDSNESTMGDFEL